MRDRQTVHPDGSRIAPEIAGVSFRPAVTQADERGTLTEIYSTRWPEGLESAPHVYEVTALPGSVRAWVVHLDQDDRLYFSVGLLKIGLYDARPGSPSEGVGTTLFAGAHAPGLLTIPRGVYHGIRNVGVEPARFLNLPTRAYDPLLPDKFRLPSSAPAIPLEL
jgi:dTDP-4-dehydrorhamnose 3,5-epimerase